MEFEGSRDVVAFCFCGECNEGAQQAAQLPFRRSGVVVAQLAVLVESGTIPLTLRTKTG